MAIRNNPRRHAIERPKRGYVPRLPHSSWRINALAGFSAPDANSVTNANDFWARLGV